MNHSVAADIGAINQLAVFVEVQSPGVAAALAEQLETPGDRVIAPDALLELQPANMGRHRAALAAIEPAVRSPGERVGDRMRVFHPEPAEQNLRIGVGD